MLLGVLKWLLAPINTPYSSTRVSVDEWGKGKSRRVSFDPDHYARVVRSRGTIPDFARPHGPLIVSTKGTVLIVPQRKPIPMPPIKTYKALMLGTNNGENTGGACSLSG